MLISQLDFKTIFQSYTNFFSDLLLSSLFRILFLLPASYLNCHCKTLNGRCSALVRFGQQKSQFPMGISLGHSEGLQRPKTPENPSSFQMNHSHHKFSFEIHNLSLSHKHNTHTHTLSLSYTHTHTLLSHTLYLCHTNTVAQMPERGLVHWNSNLKANCVKGFGKFGKKLFVLKKARIQHSFQSSSSSLSKV